MERDGETERERKRGGERGEGRGGGVLMLFLRDRGEGHINPALTAFLKEEIPSFHEAICPSVPAALHLRLGCLRPGRGWCSRSVW